MTRPDFFPEWDVVVINHNAGTRLEACVRSLWEARPRRIVVVDNGSTDGSLNLLERDLLGDGRVLIVRNGANRGFAWACNRGLRRTGAPFVLFLNPDCHVEPDAPGRLALALAEDSRAGAAGGFLCNPDGSEQPGGRRLFPSPWTGFWSGFGLSRWAGGGRAWDYRLHREPLPTGPTAVDAVSGACLMVKRDALAAVGTWDEGYFLHCEDLDWCMRFHRAGWTVLFVPEARVTLWRGTCGRARFWFVEWHKHRGMVRYFNKFHRERAPAALGALVVAGVWIHFLWAVFLRVVCGLPFLGCRREMIK